MPFPTTIYKDYLIKRLKEQSTYFKDDLVARDNNRRITIIASFMRTQLQEYKDEHHIAASLPTEKTIRKYIIETLNIQPVKRVPKDEKVSKKEREATRKEIRILRSFVASHKARLRLLKLQIKNRERLPKYEVALQELRNEYQETEKALHDTTLALEAILPKKPMKKD